MSVELSAETKRKTVGGIVAPRIKTILRPAFVCASYLFALFVLRSVASGPHALVEPWHLPAGFGVGVLLVFGFQYSPLVFAGQVIASLWPGSSGEVSYAVLAGALTTAAYVLAAYLVRLVVGDRRIDLLQTRHLVAFLGMLPVTAFVASLGSVTGLWLDGLIPSTTFIRSMMVEAAANATGILLVTPAFLLHLAPCIETLLRRMAGEERISEEPPRNKRWVTSMFFFACSIAICSVFVFAIPNQFVLFCVLSMPLVAAAMKHGSPGVAGMLATFGCLAMAANRLDSGFDGEFATQLVVIASAVNALGLGSFVSHGHGLESTTRRQTALLNSVGFATDQLLAMTDREQTVSAVLQSLAQEAGMTRTYVLENRSETASAAQPLYEYWRTGAPSDEHLANLVKSILRERIAENAATLGEGKVLQYRITDLSERDQDILAPLKLRASIILPIFVDGRLWGCLGMDEANSDRLWPETEVNAFKATGRVLAALLSHANVEQQFRQLTGNIPAVFWIAAPDGLEKTYVSPAYEQIWGWPYESIRNNPRSWIAPIYHEDYARIAAAVPKQMRGEYDEEYRIVRSDRSVRWIRETAFPVRDTSGQVNRIVGIAQDITRQKEAEEGLRATSVLLSSLIDNLHAGIVVEDQSRKIIHLNPAFCKMFDITAPIESILGTDSKLVFREQQVWAKRSDEIIRSGQECRAEEIISESGRVFLRDYFPLSVDGDWHYHLWRYEDITDRKRSEERIRASLKEKEVLLKEIHHRVKNNLQVISSLLNLQANQIRDKETAQVFRDSQSRVKAMSLVHERLYQSSDLARIDFAGYVQDVTRHLLRSYQSGPRGVKLKVDVDPVSFNIDTAIPCALIINELVSNSLKYAFPNGKDGEILIRLNQTDSDDLNLCISDNGIGFPHDVSWEKTDSLGLQLVRSLTDQLNGSIKCQLDSGAKFDIRFRPLVSDRQK
ncbi:MAG TPA: histidine kinase dimerization/phosphoacceptor domain -containing protein [Terriglobia bacterium]|nr:histidine kinase dimerization/phosphoacceptor domain -containing protein [Terriglobia bacterium]